MFVYFCNNMKKFFANLSLKARIAFLSVMAGLSSVPSFAQAGGTSDPVTEAILRGSSDSLAGIIPGIVKVLKYAVLIGGAISLLLVVFNIIQGERDAAKKAGWWLVGLGLGFAILSILETVTARIG